MTNKLKSITINDNEVFLRQISENVDIKNDNELSYDIAVLDSFCKENSVMAMAAVQLGIPKRIVYLKNTNLDISPIIIKSDNIYNYRNKITLKIKANEWGYYN